MAYEMCKECGGWGDPKYHACPPMWNAWDADNYGGDEAGSDAWMNVRAHHADDAATKAAEKMDDDSGEGPHKRVVFVKKVGSPPEEKAIRFEIDFEYSVDYSAYEADA